MKSRIFLVIAALIFTATIQAQTTVDSIAAKYKLIPMPEPLTIEKTFPVLGTYQLSTGADASMSTVTNSSASATTTTPASADAATTTQTAFSNNVTITLDSANKGVIWVEGLPQGKFKAYLKRSPSTYRVLAQKTESGQSVPEGTLIFDPETKVLNIALGKEFDETDPAAIFALNPAVMATTTDAAAPADNTVKVKVKTANTKTKSKVTYFSANKLEQTTTSSDATAPAATQQPAQQ